MGLDISWYSKFGKPIKDDERETWDNKTMKVTLFRACENPPFAGRMEGIKEGFLYPFAEHDGFRAGSYSGYNEWRRWLASLVGTTPEAVWELSEQGKLEGPFVELINFSDCEGTIGPVVSKKLAKDFADFEERAKASADKKGADGPWYLEKYKLWKLAFEKAADNGAVDFH